MEPDESLPKDALGESSPEPKKRKKKVPDFAPHDLTDGRKPLDWKSRYDDKRAIWGIRGEALYLAVRFFGSACFAGLTIAGIPESWLPVAADPPRSNKLVHQCLLAWFAGTFGGVLFAIKWLYHSVAKNIWHEDRRLWRLFTPHLSGGLGVAFLVLAASGIVSIIDKTLLESDFAVLGLGFIVGYFSDSASGKLAEVAETLFGSTRPKQ